MQTQASKQHSLFCNLTKFHLVRYCRLLVEHQPVNRLSWLRDGDRIKRKKDERAKKAEGGGGGGGG